jgi:preprotein translocase subunit SecD
VATKTSKPGRTLVVFILVIAAMFAAAAGLGNWKPRLGLDLQGGTRITLQAKSDSGGSVTSDKLDEASSIINNRVNGAGVAESEVTTQGSDIIVVEIPGKVDPNLERTIGTTAQLRFRLVSLVLPPASQTPTESPTPTTGTTTGPTTGTTTGPTTGSTTGPTQSSGTGPKATPRESKPTSTDKTTSKNRVGGGWLEDGSATTTPTTTAPTTGGDPTTPTTPESTTEPAPAGPPSALLPPDLVEIKDPYAWIANPPQEWQAKLASYTCPGKGEVATDQVDLPSQPLLACNDDGFRYLLGPAMVEGTTVKDASYGIPNQGVNWVVNVSFNSEEPGELPEVRRFAVDVRHPEPQRRGS